MFFILCILRIDADSGSLYNVKKYMFLTVWRINMNAHFYHKIMRPFRMHPKYIYPLNYINRLITLSGFLLYPLLLLIIAVHRDKRFFAVLFIPAFFFLAMSRIRKLVNSPRPYEVFDIIPLIPRDGTGQSFPSRHVFSIFLIGTLWFDYFIPAGILLFVLGAALACIRVIAGVHFPKDVLCGAALGIISGALTLWISTL